ncbi:hypothetical protein [Rhodohalobacter halophilus]|uniref:hypothetical protein n=1 Tax=Rhodohalobacter halophilus TaxID=1812810 RepID=UPI00083FD98D|nr:hypothetical protein [Rhodohalobacter halophilus]
MESGRQRKFIALLLALSCLTAIYLLLNSSPLESKKLTHSSQIDSLITESLRDFNIPPSQVRKRTVEIDSTFSRSVYTVRVAPNFSKTTLHYTLHKSLWPFNVRTAGRVHFPERDLNVHFLYNDRVVRTLIVRHDPDLRLQQHQPEILPGQDSHEVD